MGLIRSDLESYGSLLNFEVTDGWLQSLCKRMNFSSRTATISRPVITRSIWEEVRTKILHDIVSVCIKCDIPDELIINVDQTPSKYVATEKITMAEKNSRHVSKKGKNAKRQITLIYKGKTSRSVPSVNFPAGFLLSVNEHHWSNENETLNGWSNCTIPGK